MKCTTVFLWFCFIFRKCPGFGVEVKKMLFVVYLQMGMFWSMLQLVE